VVIAGNWYHRDGIEIYDGDKDFKYLKDVSVQRSSPYIFRIAKDDAIIFGSLGIKGDTVFSAVADRVKGDSIHIPLFETWHPLQSIFNHSARCFIGDESKELYTYLLAVKDSSGQVAIAKVENGAFSLLPTDVPVPMESQWEKIEYCTSIIADTKRGKAYLLGSGSSFLTKKDKPLRRYILCIDYANAANGGAATLKLFYTEPMSDTPEVPVLDDDGNLLTAGGMLGRSNFTPSPYVYQMFVAGQPIAEEKGSNWLVTGLTIILVTQILIAFLVIYMRRKRQKRQKPVTVITGNSYSESDESNDLMAYNLDTTSAGVSDKQLMAIIAEAMEVNKLYLRADLKVSDIAEAIGARRNDVSACINSTLNCTVSQFINNYRIEYAKQLLLKNPTKKISSVWMESGFSNEQTFFRTFRASTGKSPKEWILQKID